MKESYLSSVYDIEEIIRANLDLEIVPILEVDHVIRGVLANNLIVCEGVCSIATAHALKLLYSSKRFWRWR